MIGYDSVASATEAVGTATMIFTSLSPDVLILIFSLLNPIDILSLRATCRTICKLTYERAVWASALVREHEGHKVSLSSFNHTSASSEELEKMTLIPYRLASKILEADSRIRPMGIRLLVKPSSEMFGMDDPELEEDDEDPDFTNVLLVPGGRYLFTCSRGRVAALWDLGQYADSMIGNSPMAVIDPTEHEGVSVWLEEVSTNPNNQYELRIIIRIHHRYAPAGTRTTYRVYDINPSSTGPTFSLVAESELIKPKKGRSERAYRAFNGRLFALLKNDILVVWDISTNTVMTEQTPATAIAIAGDTIYVFHELTQTFCFTVTVSDEGVSLLNRHKTGHILLTEVDDYSRTQTRVYPVQRSSLLDTLPVTFEIPSPFEDGDTCTYSIVELRLTGGQATSHPLETIESTDLGIQFDIRPQLANSYLLLGRFLDVSNASIIANIAEINTKRNGEQRRLNTVALYSTPMNEFIEEGGYDFCPLSGRLVVILYGEVRVLDYLRSTRPFSKEVRGCEAR